jgi:predicted nucleic acid-binding protein
VILVDTSVWIDHLRAGNNVLASLLDAGRVLSHPFVIGELALGNLRNRDLLVSTMDDLPQAGIVTNGEVLHFIGRYALYGAGIGYVDAHLLASVRLTAGAVLWTQDKRLLRAAEPLGLAISSPQ